MKFKTSKIDIFAVDIPFKMKFGHAAKKRVSSESIFVRVEAESGEVGFGESLPRHYVTGEDQISVISALKEKLPGAVLGRSLSSFKEAVALCDSLVGLKGAAKCAIELAILDAAGKVFNCSAADLFDKTPGGNLRYSVVIGSEAPLKAGLSALKCRLYGIKAIKLKVGDPGDIGRLRIVRRAAGADVDIRLDANCAWTDDEAINNLAIMRTFNFSVIEEPVKKGNTQSLKKVSAAIPEPVMADESMCTIDDANKLAEARACKMFNIRISKCGGILNSIKIARIAKAAGIMCQLGCQVGESGVLSAAGRHFAACTEGIKYLEGSYAKFLLAEDVVNEDVSFGYGGSAPLLTGAGLGVTVNESILNKYKKNKITIQ
ncbi:MAG: enolase C-terminal domain-like protein [Candidatus Omnitrophica bacterium]|nr:enolase C-terminal domain-like protein [Candidatus Omnitrophota bacterium]